MERVVLLRFFSSSALISTRFFTRSAHRLASLPRRQRLVPNGNHRSLLGPHFGLVSSVSRPSLLQLERNYFYLISKGPNSSKQSSPENDEVEKLGFEKISEDIIDTCCYGTDGTIKYKSIAYLYKHKKTGCEIVCLSDVHSVEKIFSIAFRTPRGVVIPERSVLCGSRKYPQEDPFIELWKGRLHTFLDLSGYPDRTCTSIAAELLKGSKNTSITAFTYSDRPCYYVSSTNNEDFNDVVDMHLDAVFFPECVEDVKTLSKGVHFSMEEIIFKKWKEFHQKYYHPSNARIWFYGDDDANERLRVLSEYLDKFEANSEPQESQIKHPELLSESPKLLSEPNKKNPDRPEAGVRIVQRVSCPYHTELTRVCLSWLLSETPLDFDTESDNIRLKNKKKKKNKNDPVEALQDSINLSIKRIKKPLHIKRDLMFALEPPTSFVNQCIRTKPIHIPIEVGEINGTKVLRHDLYTHGDLYAEVVFNMSSLKQELLPLSLQEMGTKDLDFVQLNQLIGSKTGGISVYASISSVRGKVDPCSHIIVRGKAMSERAEDLFNLVNCVIQEVQLTDQKRFKQFVSQSKARMENRLRFNGHGIAAARMDAKLNVAGWMNEQMCGVSYLEFLQDLEKKVDDDWHGISFSLEEIRKTLFLKHNCLVNLTAVGRDLQNSEKYISKFLDMLPNNSPVGSTPWDARLPTTNEAIVIPTHVNNVGKAANLYETGYQLKGSAYVISNLIRNSWLDDFCGAYRVFCDFDTQSGVFSFLSYRDPNLLKTLDVYDGTSKFLREFKLDTYYLSVEIEAMMSIDKVNPLPDAQGYSSLMRYLLGITEEERQMRHEEIYSTRLKDVREFADVIESIKDKGVVVAVACPEDVAAANQSRPNYFEVKKAL